MRSSLLLLAVLLAMPVVAAPIASVPMNIDGLEIDILGVDRRANVLTVKWAVRNVTDKPIDVQFALVSNNPTTYIVDEESGTKYFVLTDKEGNVLATEHVWVKSGSYGIAEQVPAGKSGRFW